MVHLIFKSAFSYLFLLVMTMEIGLSQTATEQDMENDPRNTAGISGLVEIRLQNKVLNFERIKQLGGGNYLLGITSLGLEKNIMSLDRVLPISFDIMIDSSGKTSLHEYDISLLGDGFATQVNSYYSHKADFSIFNFDREQFRENGAPLQVDRFKMMNLKYTGYITVVPGVIKLTFSGQLAPLQGTRYASVPTDLSNLMKDQTQDADITFGSTSNSPWHDKVFGRPEIYHNRRIQKSVDEGGFAKTHINLFDGMLGDSALSFGLELFNFIDAKMSLEIDGAQTISDDNAKASTYFIEFDSVKKSFEVDANFGKRFPKTKGLRKLTLFAKVSQEKSNLHLEVERNENVQVLSHSTFNNTQGSIGIRWNLNRSKK